MTNHDVLDVLTFYDYASCMNVVCTFINMFLLVSDDSHRGCCSTETVYTVRVACVTKTCIRGYIDRRYSKVNKMFMKLVLQ